MVDYKNGKIYIVRNTVNDKIYVGSTCVLLCERLRKHRSEINTKEKKGRLLMVAMRELGKNNFCIELLENYACENKEQLKAREGYYQRLYKSYINGYNKKIEDRTRDEWLKDNEERVKEYQYKWTRKYRKENKDKLHEKEKEYRQSNKHNIDRKVLCAHCSLQLNIGNVIKHVRRKHDNTVKTKEGHYKEIEN